VCTPNAQPKCVSGELDESYHMRLLQAAVVTSAPVVLAAARRHIDDLRAESLAYALTVLVDRLRDLAEDQVGYISGL
jgi:hypothetical protein